MQRMIGSLLLSIVLVLVTAPKFIPWLRKLKFGQTIYDLGPQAHKAKQGTPTMGGLMMVFAVVVTTLLLHPKGWYGWQDFMLALLAVSLLSMLVGRCWWQLAFPYIATCIRRWARRSLCHS